MSQGLEIHSKRLAEVLLPNEVVPMLRKGFISREGRDATGRRFLVGVGCIAAALVAIVPAVASAKLAYTEAVAADGTLTASFSEPGLKKLASVDYQLKADVTATWDCDAATTSTQVLGETKTTTVVPGGNGHAVGSISIAVQSSPSGCAQLVLREVDYTSVTLTNLTTGTVYPLDSISRTFP
jgi:hypothetical protein